VTLFHFCYSVYKAWPQLKSKTSVGSLTVVGPDSTVGIGVGVETGIRLLSSAGESDSDSVASDHSELSSAMDTSGARF